jgi:hypothetical protein
MQAPAVMPVHNGEVEGAVPELLDGRHVIGNGIIDRLVGLVIRMIERNVTIGDVADVAPLELVLDNLEPAWLVLDACQRSEAFLAPSTALRDETARRTCSRSGVLKWSGFLRDTSGRPTWSCWRLLLMGLQPTPTDSSQPLRHNLRRRKTTPGREGWFPALIAFTDLRELLQRLLPDGNRFPGSLSFWWLTSRLPSPALSYRCPQRILQTKLTRPLPTKAGGVLRAVEDVRALT